MITEEKKDEKKSALIYILGLIVFILQLIYFDSSISWNDALSVVYVFIVLYLFKRRENWIKPHQEGIWTFVIVMAFASTIKAVLVN